MLTIPQDHIPAAAGRAQSLGAPDSAQRSGEVLIHHAADVPLEIGKKDTAGIPFSLDGALPLHRGFPYFFHRRARGQGIAADQTQNVTGTLFPSGSALLWMSGILKGKQFAPKGQALSLGPQGKQDSSTTR